MDPKNKNKIIIFVSIVLVVGGIISVLALQSFVPKSKKNQLFKTDNETVITNYGENIKNIINKIKSKKLNPQGSENTIAFSKEGEGGKIVSITSVKNQWKIDDTKGVSGNVRSDFSTANNLLYFYDGNQTVINFNLKNSINQLKYLLASGITKEEDSKKFPYKVISAFPSSLPTDARHNETSGGFYFYIKENKEKSEQGTFVLDSNSNENVKISDKFCNWLTFNEKQILCLENNKLYGLSEETKEYGNFQQCVEGKELYCIKNNQELYQINLKNLAKQDKIYKVKDTEKLEKVSYTKKNEIILHINQVNNEYVNYQFKDGKIIERKEFKNFIIIN